MPVGAEAAAYGGSALAYTSGRGGGAMGYDAGDADLFEANTSRQQLLETTRSARVRCGTFSFFKCQTQSERTNVHVRLFVVVICWCSSLLDLFFDLIYQNVRVNIRR